MSDPRVIFTETGYDAEDFDEAYQGSYEDGMLGFVYSRAADGALDIPADFLAHHWGWIDWAAIVTDLECEGYWTALDSPGSAYRSDHSHVFSPV